jgi:hypothetical protein
MTIKVEGESGGYRLEFTLSEVNVPVWLIDGE